MYPTSDQKAVLNRWLWAIRFTYNKCVEWLNSDPDANYWRSALREKFVKTSSPVFAATDDMSDVDKQRIKDVLSVPFDIRDGAVADVVLAYQAYWAKKPENRNGFELHYRSSRSQSQQTIAVLGKHWGTHQKGKYAPVFSNNVLASSKQEPLPEFLPADAKLTKDRLGRYYLCVPQPVQTRPEREKHDIVSIDPGVRTFLTCYSPTAGTTEIGVGDSSRLNLLQYHLDELRIKMKKVKHRARYRMKRAAMRMESRIRNLVDDVHKKAARWLLDRFKLILLPEFSSSGMTRRKRGAAGTRRTLAKSTVRAMLHWSHFRFRERLLQAGKVCPTSRVVIVTEEFTSQTCGKCGQISGKYSNKQFSCKRCELTCDRDLMASRNILIKWLTERSAMKGRKSRGVELSNDGSALRLGPGPCSRSPCDSTDKDGCCKTEKAGES